MGMDSKKLSQREKQPGHDQTYRISEKNFAAFLRRVLDNDLFAVEEKPSDLKKMLPNPGVEGARKVYGIEPEASVTHKPSGRKLYFEVKRQGKGGNADERACKHHTAQFQKTVKSYTGFAYHPFITIMCEELARYPKYLAKHPYFFEPDHYFCWGDYTDEAEPIQFIERVIRKFLLDGDDGAQVIKAR